MFKYEISVAAGQSDQWGNLVKMLIHHFGYFDILYLHIDNISDINIISIPLPKTETGRKIVP